MKAVYLDIPYALEVSRGKVDRFTEKTDVFITSTPVGAAADISAGFDLYLMDNVTAK